MKNKILAQGAEATITLSNNFIIKDRIKKPYRIKEIDEKIRKQRTKKEAKLLEKASSIINCPKPFFIPDKISYKIKMPFIKGKKLSEHLNNFQENKQIEIMKQIGQNVAKLHDNNIIHGDLTTSNMILVEEDNLKEVNNKNINLINNHINHNIADLKANRNNINNISNKTNSYSMNLTNNSNNEVGGRRKEDGNFKVFFIDFGLGFHSTRIEDKAVDIHLLKQALEAKHFKNWKKLFDGVLIGYLNYKEYKQVLEQLNKVERRGRYKH
ncbi:MAG: RIO1 family regulatory kinase/ATPase [Nanoarchaeota archaeon]